MDTEFVTYRKLMGALKNLDGKYITESKHINIYKKHKKEFRLIETCVLASVLLLPIERWHWENSYKMKQVFHTLSRARQNSFTGITLKTVKATQHELQTEK